MARIINYYIIVIVSSNYQLNQIKSNQVWIRRRIITHRCGLQFIHSLIHSFIHLNFGNLNWHWLFAISIYSNQIKSKSINEWNENFNMKFNIIIIIIMTHDHITNGKFAWKNHALKFINIKSIWLLNLLVILLLKLKSLLNYQLYNSLQQFIGQIVVTSTGRRVEFAVIIIILFQVPDDFTGDDDGSGNYTVTLRLRFWI